MDRPRVIVSHHDTSGRSMPPTETEPRNDSITGVLPFAATSDSGLQVPFEAYIGDEPFVFVSYSHLDAEVVFPELARLNGEGYRIWYDEGIAPSAEWSTEITKALKKASFFMVFISPEAVKSDNVRDEIHFALKHKKPFLAVHIAKTVLPDELDFRMGRIQALMLWQGSRSAHYRKLKNTLPPDLIRSDQPAPSTGGTPAVIVPTKSGAPDSDTGLFTLSKRGNVEMVFIPAGEFIMGDDDQSNNKRRSVYLDAYRIGKTPVTVGQFKAYCQDKGIDFNTFPKPRWGWIDDHPMVNVTWQQARDFCQWAGGDLPTGAQWEKAARGVDGRKYPWGNDWDGSRLQWSSDGIAGSAKMTSAVTANLLGVSPNGCLDMAGNVWQWCSDWYVDKLSGPDRKPPLPDTSISRVLHGGSWFNDYPDFFRSARRFYDLSTLRDGRIGFRLAGPL